MQQLAAVGSLSDGSSQEITNSVTWNSSDPTIATVSATGMVIGIKSGAATVTAKISDSVSGSREVTVTGAALTHIAVVPYQPVAGIGISEQFVAVGRFDDNSTRQLVAVNWSSSDASIVKMNAIGIATTLSDGRATITGASGPISGQTDVTVLPTPLVAINITPDDVSFPAGTTQQMKATGVFSDGATMDLSIVNWTSNDPSVAAASESGVITGAKAGSATITARSGTVSGTTTAKITAAALVGLAVSPAAPQIPIYATKQFSATGIFDDGSTHDVTSIVSWTSQKPDIARIDRAGLSSGKSVGNTTMTASLGAASASTPLTVSSARVIEAKLSPESPTIPKGTKIAFELTGYLSDGTTQLIESPSWSSASPWNVTIMQDGVASGRESGTSRIYGMGCCETGTTVLTVSNAKLQSIAVTSTYDQIGIGAAARFKADGAFLSGGITTQQDITNAVHWSSSAPDVITIDQNGVAVGHAAGTATITAMFGPVAGTTTTMLGSATVRVSSATLQSISVTPGNASIDLGAQQAFTIVGSFSDGSIQDVTHIIWQSSEAKVAVVNQRGVAVSTGKGSTVITVSSGNVQAQASLTVN